MTGPRATPAALTPAQASRQAVFLTACRLLARADRHALRLTLGERGLGIGLGERRRFELDPLAWLLALDDAGDAAGLAAFWRLVEDEHAAQAAAAAATDP